jgi:hypothetical protein
LDPEQQERGQTKEFTAVGMIYRAAARALDKAVPDLREQHYRTKAGAIHAPHL